MKSSRLRRTSPSRRMTTSTRSCKATSVLSFLWRRLPLSWTVESWRHYVWLTPYRPRCKNPRRVWKLEDHSRVTNIVRLRSRVRPRSLMLKGACNAQEVVNFLWHLKNYFKCNRVKTDESKSIMWCCTSQRWTFCVGGFKSQKLERDFPLSTFGRNSKWSSRRLSTLTMSVYAANYKFRMLK